MKKMLSYLLILIMVLALVGCGGESAEQAVKNTFDAIKSNDRETASRYIDYDELLNVGESGEASLGEMDEESQKMAELILKHFNYKIISSKEEGDTATVTAEITNVNMQTIMASFISEAFSLAFSGLNEEQMAEEMSNKFTELINREDNETVTKTVDIALTKDGDSWKVDMSEEAGDAIFGGMITLAQEMSDAFSQ
ncbi:MAG: hypothetical protein K0R19_2594 [Bacillota bacterium]|jgi:PBP1b-binding outer membrane lipoprotein LpoB|nr:hypothetical protein [Bacillota bacterium]